MSSYESPSEGNASPGRMHQNDLVDSDDTNIDHILKGEPESNFADDYVWGRSLPGHERHRALSEVAESEGDVDIKEDTRSGSESAFLSGEDDEDSTEDLDAGASTNLGEEDVSEDVSEDGISVQLGEADNDHMLAYRLRIGLLEGDSPGTSGPHRSLSKRSLDSDGDTTGRPFKRLRSEFNYEYLDMLDAEISAAATQMATEDEEELEDSQIGLTVWKSSEKERFFEALSRLGPDDAVGISRRIRTKGEMEVRQYLNLLQDGLRTQKSERRVDPLGMLERSAAMELSQACCSALEAAGDEISVREENYEIRKEQRRWGQYWQITPYNLEAIKAAPPPGLKSLELFAVHMWLRMSSRVFMNSAVPEYNWRYFSGLAPGIRVTALEDFRSLAICMTRRLVAVSIAMAEARIRSRRAAGSVSERVRWRDVETAALSIGLNTTAREFWAKSARRLRLNVAANLEDASDSGGSAILSYDEAEQALGLRSTGGKNQEVSSREEDDVTTTTSEEPVSLESESEDDGHSVDSETLSKAAEELGVHDQDIKQEMEELFLHSALNYPPTRKPRRAARARITSELIHEAHADRVDARASYKEEKDLWAMLGKEPPEKPARVKKPSKAPQQYGKHLLSEFYPTGENWRDKVDCGISEWEFVYGTTQQKPCEET
ncbi:hypothetical protein GQ53DRAFT_747901 [Thozetella sp. PMI_491]|nr:hypothetical protein GQ53DRAFT_747901 [Thozetella sp. PMI_491]